MSADGLRTKWRRNIAENFNRLSRVHERYRQTTDDRQTTDEKQTTDGRTTTYGEREREFTFANNRIKTRCVCIGVSSFRLVRWQHFFFDIRNLTLLLCLLFTVVKP